MVGNETKELLGEHMIKDSIKADLSRVKSSPEMLAFMSGLAYKSEISKKRDLDLVNMLLLKLEQYAEGWIRCNSNKTAELWNNSLLLDEQRENLKSDAIKVNELANKVIAKLSHRMQPERLEELRNMERQLRKL